MVLIFFHTLTHRRYATKPHRSDVELRPSVPEEELNGPRVVHLQYNSPLGMYTRQNVEHALEDQTAGRAGYGTMT